MLRLPGHLEPFRATGARPARPAPRRAFASPVCALTTQCADRTRPLALSGLLHPTTPSPEHAEYLPEVSDCRLSPAQAFNQISAEVAKVLTDPQVRQQLDAQGLTAVGGDPSKSAAFSGSAARSRWRCHRRELDKFKRTVELSL